MKTKKIAQNIHAVETQSAEEHAALAEELNKLAKLHVEMAELKEEQQAFAMYTEFCKVRIEWHGLAGAYEEAGDLLRAEAIRRSVPVAPELLDYLKRNHDRRYFEDVLLGKANIYEALLIYGPDWLDYDEEKAVMDPLEQMFAEKKL